MSSFEDVPIPVMAGARVPNKEHAIAVTTVYGTCVSVGGGYLLTAGHVLEGATQQPYLGVPYKHSGQVLAQEVIDYEIIRSHDIGIIKVNDVPGFVVPIWSLDDPSFLGDVVTAGYPFGGIDRSVGNIQLRGYKGYLVTSYRFTQLPARPVAFELSFQAPQGLSGAPLFAVQEMSQGSEMIRVIGLIIGNNTVEMNVVSSAETETITESGRDIGVRQTVFQRSETFHAAVALRALDIAAVQSRLLGGTLEAHLEMHGLVA